MKEYIYIYRMLEDKESKDIWLSRLNYLITGDYTYIDYIVENYCSKVYNEYSGGVNLDKKSEVIFYGAGERAKYMRIPVNVKLFCDQDEKKQKEGFRGYQVISVDELIKRHRNADIVITSRQYYEEIKENLIEEGFDKRQIYGIYNLSERQYFDESFLKFDHDEVFVDAGAYDLTTTLEFAQRCKDFKKIYAFEPDENNIRYCNKRKAGEKRIEIVPFGTWSEKNELRFRALGNWSSKIDDMGEETISVTAIDNVVKEKVTYIKMDVEGAELETLKGAKNIICRDKPKLAVCIYHKPEDMTDLPIYIKSLVPEYKLYVRHYSEEKYETILYAIR